MWNVRVNCMIMSQTGRELGRLQARHQLGMTLVEVVVAMAITGMAVGGIVNGYNYCTNSAQKAALMLAANARAMERIEATRSATWAPDRSPAVDQLVATNFPNKTVTLDLSGSGAVTIPATIQTEISQVSVNPPLKRIRVACVWQFRGVQWVTNSLETCRAPEQ
jgi:prepilin-type N-terminal cleavage/methylation domain-containing protein